MTQNDFNIQLGRIYSVFGEKQYGKERLSLIWQSCKELSDYAFIRIVDNFISSARFAPLPKDFKDAAIAEKSKSFNDLVDGAVESVFYKSPDGIKNYLNKDYPGCSTIYDAVKLEMFKNRIKKIDEVSNNI